VETTFPDGQKFWTVRDGLGRMKAGYRGALGDLSVQTTLFHYDRASNLYYFGRGSSTSTYSLFDNVGRPARIYEQFGHPSGDSNFTFAYNPAGQLRSESRTNDAYAWTEGAAASRDYAVNGQNQYTAVGQAARSARAPSATFGMTRTRRRLDLKRVRRARAPAWSVRGPGRHCAFPRIRDDVAGWARPW
jgi:hypothetical protein